MIVCSSLVISVIWVFFVVVEIVGSSIGCCRCAQQVVSEHQATLGILRIRRAPDLIRLRSCVDLRRTQGGLVESVFGVDPVRNSI